MNEAEYPLAVEAELTAADANGADTKPSTTASPSPAARPQIL
jgi:hypothetical protein